MTTATKKVIPLARYDAAQPSPYHPYPPPSQPPDQEWSEAGPRLRDWARHLEKNSAIARAVLSSRQSNGVGEGLRYEPMVKARNGELLPEVNDALRRIHSEWSDDVSVDGELTRQELELLVWVMCDRDGEVFVRRVFRPEGYRLQIIPSEWIPSGYSQMDVSLELQNGIVRDQWGKPLEYLVDPNAEGFNAPGLPLADRIIRLPASDVWHYKRREDALQGRGISLFHAVILRIADLSEYMQSHRLAARASADLYASINRAADMDPDSASSNEWQFDRLQILDELAPGESVNFHKPEHPNVNAKDFIESELRMIASGTDSGFSEIAQVFDASYAAQRLEVVFTWRKILRDRKRFISDFAQEALWNQVVTFALLTQQLPARGLRAADQMTLYDVRIHGPSMPVIDPVKDRQAMALDQENGWDSRHGIIRNLGRDPAQVDAEIAQDQMRATANAAESTE